MLIYINTNNILTISNFTIYVYHLCVFQKPKQMWFSFRETIFACIQIPGTFNKYHDGNHLFYRRNEEVDEKSLIKKLRKRVAELESELSCLLMAKVIWSKCEKKKKIIHAMDRCFLWMNRKRWKKICLLAN